MCENKLKHFVLVTHGTERVDKQYWRPTWNKRIENKPILQVIESLQTFHRQSRYCSPLKAIMILLRKFFLCTYKTSFYWDWFYPGLSCSGQVISADDSRKVRMYDQSLRDIGYSDKLWMFFSVLSEIVLALIIFVKALTKVRCIIGSLVL